MTSRTGRPGAAPRTRRDRRPGDGGRPAGGRDRLRRVRRRRLRGGLLGPRRRTRDGPGLKPRALIADAIGPVWEANHTWLIFDLVILWTAFPPAFAAIMTTLFVPLCLVALGMVLRGAAFAFRPVATTLRGRQAAGAVFAISSVLTPFLLGAVAGAIASGRVIAAGAPPPQATRGRPG